jgi:hypothetical protein
MLALVVLSLAGHSWPAIFWLTCLRPKNGTVTSCGKSNIALRLTRRCIYKTRRRSTAYLKRVARGSLLGGSQLSSLCAKR